MFLSYGYYSLGDFYLCRVLIDSQRVIGVDSSFQKGFYYNDHMCNGILENVSHSYEEAVQSFKRAFMTI